MKEDLLLLLKTDVAAFNTYRRETKFAPIDLKGADLRDTNLRGANLRDTDLRGANLDYSCIPLWCGSLRMKTDERQRKQIAYHLASLFVHAESISDEEKTIYRAIANYANGFHRIGECPELEPNL